MRQIAPRDRSRPDATFALTADTAGTADIVIIGAGHNGLVCAAYLARAGLDVIVLEQSDRPGGALWWIDWQGHQLERGAVEHTAVLTSGIVQDLDLARHGLAYRTRSVAAIHLFGDGTRIVIEETAEATAASVGQLSAADGRAWEELAEIAAPLLRADALASDGWIPPPQVATGFARAVGGRRAGALIDLTRMSVAELAQRWFEHPAVRAMVMFRAAFSSLAPWAPGSAAAFLLTVAGHGRRLGRPVGGSRAFVQALTASALDAGAIVLCGVTVDALRRSGGSWRVHTTGGGSVVARRGVVSAMAPRPFLLDILRGALTPRPRRRVEHMQEVVDNVSQLTLAAAIDDDSCLPAFGRPELDAGTMWLLAEPAAVTEAYTAALIGQLPSAPATLVTFPSVADPAAAPPGRATMWADSFVARRLHGRPWTRARSEASDAVWRTIESCLPGLHDHVRHEVVTTPDDLTAKNGAENAGNHIAPIPGQLLGARPALGFGHHRTPVDGIYLTGAGTHPGGGLSGVPGRLCARAVLDDLGLGRTRVQRSAAVVRQVAGSLRAARALGTSSDAS
ncbi:MAG: phytoene desaturase family protein [Ilumatobacteraceae bacterium]